VDVHINNFFTPDAKTGERKRVHMIGIGGSSMSGLAQMLAIKGCRVTGSDRDESEHTRTLAARGIEVFIGHKPENVEGADLVVYTAAIAPDNCERVHARELGIPEMERAVLLGQLMEGYKRAVNVCGTHGKTTTSAMLAQTLWELNTNPTVHIGGDLPALGGSTLAGGHECFVAEACEFNRSFLHFNPTHVVMLNIEADHLDCYGTFENLLAAFHQFAAKVPEDGYLIGYGDDPNVMDIMNEVECNILSFGMSDENDVYPANLTYDEFGRATCDVMLFGQPMTKLTLSVPGEYMLINALAVMACTYSLGLDAHLVAATLGHFTGVHRRFELTSVTDGVAVYTDYGHHPTEIRNVLSVAMQQPHRKLWAVWQPHTYSRTKNLFKDFVKCFDGVDHVLITDIYGAREKDPGDIKTEMLLPHLRARGLVVTHTPTFDDAENYLRKYWKPGDLVITLGCGNINLLNDQIKEHGDSVEG